MHVAIGNDEAGYNLKDVGGGSTRKVEKMNAVDASYRTKATTP